MTQRSKVDEILHKLDETDREILRTIEKRARIVGDLLRARGDGARLLPISDGARLTALEQAVSPPFPIAGVRPVFAAIDAACRVYEIAPRVVCVGPEGSFSYQAAALHFGPTAELLRAETPEKALDEVARSKADFAVIALETVREGLAFSTVQAIAALDLKLIGERELAHSLCLASKTGNAADIERVYANAQHHAMAERYLATHFPKATVLHVRNANMAAELALEHHGAAALVTSGFTLPGDLRILAENVSDDGQVRIRHGIVSRMPVSRSGNDATAVIFSVHDRPGALHDLLQVFKEKSCNLRRIQSRAVPSEGWEYVFYVEVSGHVTDRPLVAALEGVKQKARMLKIVGSFPLDAAEPPPSSEASGAHR